MQNKTKHINLICGSYEGKLIGVNVKLNSKNQVQSTSILFNHATFESSIKSIALNQDTLICGGSQQIAKEIDLISLKQTSMLLGHSGSINAIKFYSDKYLMIGSDDGNISIWKKEHDWALIHSLKTSNSSVIDFDIHPSNRLLLSISGKNVLRLWNLLNCRCIYRSFLNQRYKRVFWMRKNKSYALVADYQVAVHEYQESPENKPIIFEFESKIQTFLSFEDVQTKFNFVCGGEKGLLYLVSNLDKQPVVHPMRISQLGRIKQIKISQGFLCLATSEGIVGGISLSELNQEKEIIQLEFKIEVGSSRLLTLQTSEINLRKKKKLGSLLKQRKGGEYVDKLM